MLEIRESTAWSMSGMSGCHDPMKINRIESASKYLTDVIRTVGFDFFRGNHIE